MPAPDSSYIARILRAGQWRVTRTPDRGLLATVTWSRGGASATLTATLDAAELGAIARAVRGLMEQRGAAAGASFFQNVGRMARRIARGRILRKLSDGAADILQSPALAAAVGITSVIPGIGQGIAATYAAARLTTELVQRARRGDRQAQQQLGQVAQRAAAGNPEAQRLVGLAAQARAELSRQATLARGAGGAAAGQYMAAGDYMAAGWGAVAGARPVVAHLPRYSDGAVTYGGRAMLLRP